MLLFIHALILVLKNMAPEGTTYVVERSNEAGKIKNWDPCMKTTYLHDN